MRERKSSDPEERRLWNDEGSGNGDNNDGGDGGDGVGGKSARNGHSYRYDANHVITGALLLLCILAALDLWRQYAINR